MLKHFYVHECDYCGATEVQQVQVNLGQGMAIVGPCTLAGWTYFNSKLVCPRHDVIVKAATEDVAWKRE